MLKLSRSAVEQYLNCKRCFVLTYKYKVRLNMLPFTLNIAVDNLCKNEFDQYRKKQKPHPLFIKHNIDAVPFKHPDMDRWRNNFQGISYIDPDINVNFYGAVDDVWEKPDGELILSDVKTTSKNKFDWEDVWNRFDYPKSYKRQLEMYQWLFRKNGFKVSNTAYLLYYNGLKNESMFNQVLKFESHLIKIECNDAWVSQVLIEATNLLKAEEYPKGSISCDTCSYLKKRWDISQKN